MNKEKCTMLDSLLKERVAAWGTEVLLREKTREEIETNVFNMHYSYILLTLCNCVSYVV